MPRGWKSRKRWLARRNDDRRRIVGQVATEGKVCKVNLSGFLLRLVMLVSRHK